MGLHNVGFGDEYEREKYAKLSPLLEKYCHQMDYVITDDGVMTFKARGIEYEFLYFKFEETRFPDGTLSFGSMTNSTAHFDNCRKGVEGYKITREDGKTHFCGPIVYEATILEPIDVIKFMVEKNAGYKL